MQNMISFLSRKSLVIFWKKFIRVSMNQYLSVHLSIWISIIDIKYYFKYQGHRKNVKCWVCITTNKRKIEHCARFVLWKYKNCCFDISSKIRKLSQDLYILIKLSQINRERRKQLIVLCFNTKRIVTNGDI